MLEQTFGFSGKLDWPTVDLAALQQRLEHALQKATRAPDEESVYLRLSEQLRLLELHPPERSLWDKACHGRMDLAAVPWGAGPSSTWPLDQEGWAVLSALIDGLGEPGTGEVFRQRCVEDTVGTVCTRLLPGFVLWSTLKLALLLKNPFRVEELARKWVAALGATIDGESNAQSEARLREIDFSGSFARVERARKEEEARRRRQEEIERRRRDEYERFQRE